MCKVGRVEGQARDPRAASQRPHPFRVGARGRTRETLAGHLDLLVTLGVVQAMGETYAAA